MRNASNPTSPSAFQDASGLTLGEFLSLLWTGRWTVLTCALACLILTGLYAFLATPIYQVTAMIKVDPKQGTHTNTALEGRVESFFDDTAAALTEVEIVQSTTVLGQVVSNLHLDQKVAPKYPLFSAERWIRALRSPDTKLDLETFQVDQGLTDEEFNLRIEGNGAFALLNPDDGVLAHGKVGEELRASWEGKPLVFKVRALNGKVGQRFLVKRAFLQDCIQELRNELSVAEKTKESNVLALSLEFPDPARGTTIMNAILDAYTNVNIGRKSEEAARTLAFVREQMDAQRAKLLQSEQLLQKIKTGRSVDLTEEARLVLDRGVDIDKDIMTLVQHRLELLRTYQERADVVTQVDQQIAKLREEKRRYEAQGNAMPQTQNEVMRLTRDVQVNQDQYAALMNLETLNLQQVQVAKAGGAMNAQIVDRALASVLPVKPKKALVLAVGMILGLIGGGSLVILRLTVFQKGVKDPQVLEAHFGVPVLATIPHSASQDLITRKAQKKGGARQMLAAVNTEDLAMESLRSLRTGLHFTLVDPVNRAILIAGAAPDIGKTFVNTNFAILLAQFGARVLLVDADMRRGSIHRDFGLANRKDGLSEILAGRLSWKQALHRTHEMDLITTGILPPDPAKLLAGPRFSAFINEVCDAYDYVFLDAPPILAVTDAVLISAHVGAVLLVVKDGRHPLGEIRAALQALEIAGIQVKGFIFNDVPAQSTAAGFLNNTYYYAYQKKEAAGRGKA